MQLCSLMDGVIEKLMSMVSSKNDTLLLCLHRSQRKRHITVPHLFWLLFTISWSHGSTTYEGNQPILIMWQPVNVKVSWPASFVSCDSHTEWVTHQTIAHCLTALFLVWRLLHGQWWPLIQIRYTICSRILSIFRLI